MTPFRSKPTQDEKAGRSRALLRREDGVVIIAVLWICALIMWFALRIGSETRLQAEDQVNQFRKSQALHLAIGGCYEAIARMGKPLPSGLDDKSDDDAWQPDGRPHVIEYQTGRAMVIVEAESRKINVNKAKPDQIKAVLGKAQMDEGEAERLADVIADFVDRSDAPRLHGAKKDQYKNMGLSYGPFNGPMTSLDQMLLIPGVTPQLFFGYGRTEEEAQQNESGVTRSPLLPSNDSLFSMFTIYGTNVTLRKDEAELGQEGKQLTWENGGIYRVLSCGASSQGSPAVVIWLVVKSSPESEHGYQVLYRKIL